MENILGVILCGGQSKRMGSDKGLIEFNGKKMVEHVLESLGSHCIGIISNNDEYKQFGKPVWPDIYKNCGPLGGIHSALYHSKAGWNLIAGCDLPFVPTEFLNFLFEKTNGANADAIVRVHENKIEPLCAFYHRSCINSIEKLIRGKELKMKDALKNFNTSYIDIPMNLFGNSLFRNINTRQDLIKHSKQGNPQK